MPTWIKSRARRYRKREKTEEPKRGSFMPSTEDRHERITQPLVPLNHQEEQPEYHVPAPPEAEGEAVDTAAGEAELDDTLTLTDQDEIVTPTPMPIQRYAVRSEVPSRGAPCLLWVLVVTGLAIGLLSLALNGFLIYKLLSVRQSAVDGLDAAIAGLDNLAGQGFQYEYRLDQTVPFKGDIPFKQEFDFPFEGNFPINTTVEVPISLGIGPPIKIPFKINTTVPIKTSVPVRIDESFHVETEVPLDLTIPISIQPNDPAVRELLSPIREMLVELRESL
jgi:hypothetical protein